MLNEFATPRDAAEVARAQADPAMIRRAVEDFRKAGFLVAVDEAASSAAKAPERDEASVAVKASVVMPTFTNPSRDGLISA